MHIVHVRSGAEPLRSGWSSFVAVAPMANVVQNSYNNSAAKMYRIYARLRTIADKNYMSKFYRKIRNMMASSWCCASLGCGVLHFLDIRVCAQS